MNCCKLFARSIVAKVKALNSIQLTRGQRTRLRSSSNHDIRTCGGLLFLEVIPPEVSKAARGETHWNLPQKAGITSLGSTGEGPYFSGSTSILSTSRTRNRS